MFNLSKMMTLVSLSRNPALKTLVLIVLLVYLLNISNCNDKDVEEHKESYSKPKWNKNWRRRLRFTTRLRLRFTVRQKVCKHKKKLLYFMYCINQRFCKKLAKYQKIKLCTI